MTLKAMKGCTAKESRTDLPFSGQSAKDGKRVFMLGSEMRIEEGIQLRKERI
jgi:hypothetical protein